MVYQVVRKVLSLEHCDSGAAVLERLSREHGCVGRVATIPQVLHLHLHLHLHPWLIMSESGLIPEKIEPKWPPIFS